MLGSMVHLIGRRWEQHSVNHWRHHRGSTVLQPLARFSVVACYNYRVSVWDSILARCFSAKFPASTYGLVVVVVPELHREATVSR